METKLEVTFPKELKDEPIICNICKKFDIVLNIIEASFSTEIGWSILVLYGKEEELKKVLAYLNEKGVTINSIENKPTG